MKRTQNRPLWLVRDRRRWYIKHAPTGTFLNTHPLPSRQAALQALRKLRSLGVDWERVDSAKLAELRESLHRALAAQPGRLISLRLLVERESDGTVNISLSDAGCGCCTNGEPVVSGNSVDLPSGSMTGAAAARALRHLAALLVFQADDLEQGATHEHHTT